MPMFSEQRDLYERGAAPQQHQMTITIGTVIDTNDPQQMGRIRVSCPQWGDSLGSNVEDVPWAIFMTPFGGQVQVGTRGPGDQESTGGVAYGAWWIPKIGSHAVVVCVDGDPMNRMFIGCIFDQFTPHTMPHGRFMYDDHPKLEKAGGDPFPMGPYTSSEQFIQPLASNIKQAFGNKSEPNFEYRNRGGDYTVTRLSVDYLDHTYSHVEDDLDVSHDDWISTQGYQKSRVDEGGKSSYTDKNYDNFVYSLTSPGFHSFSMDDRQENNRIRIRTTSGAQFLLDDTNERIYMATAKGNNWVEMDQDGNIDVHTSNKLNIHASKDVNITADETIRMYAKKGIHMRSEDEIRVEALKDIHVKTPKNVRVHAETSIFIESGSNLHIKSGSSLYLQAASVLHGKSGSTMNLDSGSTMNIKASANIIQTGAAIHLNGPAASSATAATAANVELAFWTSRVPAHEPWARVMTKHDKTHEPEFEYESKSVNKSERGRSIDRGRFWRR